MQGKKPYIIKAIKEKFNVDITTKDLKNLHAKINVKPVDEVAAVTKFLLEKGIYIFSLFLSNNIKF